MRQNRLAILTAMGLTLAMASGSCNNDNENDGDAADFQQQLSDAMENNLPGFGEAIQRLAIALGGTPQEGVTLSDITNGVEGSVGVDVNGDGSLETLVNGRLVYLNPSLGIAGGATFTLTSITDGAPQTASGSAVLMQTGPTSLSLSNGTFTTHTDTRGNDLAVSDANLFIDASGSSPVVTGTADFEFNGLAGVLVFEEDGSGGFKIVVSGDGFDTFTVP